MPINFGIVLLFRNPAKWRRPFAEIYRERIELAAKAEELGFDHFWTNEHHFMEDGFSPSSIAILSAVAARTTRMRIGPYVLLLPFHNPVRIAEDAATVDIISNGRLDLAVGPGSSPTEFATFGIPIKERRARMYEGLEIVRRCFSEEEFSFAGKYWNFNKVRMTPKPVQNPVPIFVAAVGERALAEAAERGYHLAAGGTSSRSQIYSDALRRAGRDPGQFRRAALQIGHLAPTREQAWNEAEPHIHYYMTVHFAMVAQSRANDTLKLDTHQDLVVPPLGELRKTGRGPYGPAFIGTPEDVIKMIERAVKEASLTDIAFCPDLPGMDPRLIARSVELFAREVIPHFRRHG
jgi:alkanesulfonate monooxygenase SsuD/methylene tetrahydromethanopterin reductase-like flavin-dependent oxidoreductase (luciferase family)